MRNFKSKFEFWFPLGVSVLALVVSGFQWLGAREHDYLSVRPLINFIYVTDNDEQEVGLMIENSGIGPAVIKSLVIFVDRKPVSSWDQAIASGKFNNTDVIRFMEYDKHDVLKVGQKEAVFYRSTKIKNELNSFVDFVDERLAVEVTYCSLYDECRTKCSFVGRC